MHTQPLPFRIGHGFDIHRFAPGRKLILGGVEIPEGLGLDGHSDADCLTHALADAILGACALPDIGHYFPNTDQTIAGINSQHILRKACDEAERLGYRIGNCDVSIIAEIPKLAPHLPAMRHCLAETMRISEKDVGLKATTNEKLGSLGRKEGIAAHAVVMLFRNVE
ncbi:MAG: 2-C-methyl-D-erythritol 2,4-cyclodiphosphate synthase [Verrucomicrobiota bacterium]|nr:2-C-methyl-D-erythritol 2,4-cyclodiphosphate synthase [Verrucomicrobiota bacterium]